MKTRILGFLFVLFLFSTSVCAQDLDAKLAEIDAYAEKARVEWNVPGMAVVIVKDDKVVFTKGYGVQKLGSPEKVNEETLFAIASNSKAFTTASLAVLIDQGKIGGWDDKVSKYLPDFQLYAPYVTSDLTIRDIVSHRVGLGTFSGDLLWYETTYSSDEVLRRVRFLKPTHGFRTGFGYQNLMFMAAGEIVAKVSGKSWGDFVKETFLIPLKMNRTTTTVRDVKDNAAWPHNESQGNGLRVLHRGNVDSAAAAAGLNASVKDLGNWLRMQLGNGKFEDKQIVSPRNMWEMHQPAVILPVSPGAQNLFAKNFDTYGLGWNIADYRGKKVVSHGGGLDGMISKTAMMPEEKLGLVVLTNSENNVSTAMEFKIFDVFLSTKDPKDWSATFKGFSEGGKKRADENWAKLQSDRKLNTSASLPIAEFAGDYTGELYGDAEVSNENGKLVLRLKPAPNFVADLEHWHYNTFRIKWRPSVAYNFPPGFVYFKIGQNGEANELVIDQPNNDFWFYELEFKRTGK